MIVGSEGTYDDNGDQRDLYGEKSFWGTEDPLLRFSDMIKGLIIMWLSDWTGISDLQSNNKGLTEDAR